MPRSLTGPAALVAPRPRRSGAASRPRLATAMALGLAAALWLAPVRANEEPDHGGKPAAAAAKPMVNATGALQATTTADPRDVAQRIREALGTAKRQPAEAKAAAPTRTAAAKPATKAVKGAADAHAHPPHWSYEGETGPAKWGELSAEFEACARGQRQSPINIQSGSTLLGPAEPVTFNYQPSNASVVNNGHTIQVDVQGDNHIVVRGLRYTLIQFHFHNPSEEQINGRAFPMVAHLVHRSDMGQLAVVAVLLEAGADNPLMHKVWTYLPLDVKDRVPMPAGLLDLREILPTDPRYYQFMGSLTTPPCSEGVLWMVMKKPVPVGAGQLRVFSQLFPMNARPVQALNGRPVREAQ